MCLFLSGLDPSREEFYMANYGVKEIISLLPTTIAFGNLAERSARAFTPVAGKTAFDSTRHGDFEIFPMHADGTNLSQITHDSANAASADWSPDGKTLSRWRLRDMHDRPRWRWCHSTHS